MTGRPTRVRIVGAGRAGGSFARALGDAGWVVDLVHHDHPDPARQVDLVLACLPDAAVATVVTEWPVHPDVVVAHCAGSLGLDVLAPHTAVGSVHPLVSLPDPATGAARLHGAWFGVAGDESMRSVVDALGGTAVRVDDPARATYHAAAVVASNHLVALMGQVERLAGGVGVPLDAYLELARGSLANVGEVGAPAALTGPVARGDWDTVRRHLAALAPDERPAYVVMALQAARLVDGQVPHDVADGVGGADVADGDRRPDGAP